MRHRADGEQARAQDARRPKRSIDATGDNTRFAVRRCAKSMSNGEQRGGATRMCATAGVGRYKPQARPRGAAKRIIEMRL